MRNRLRILRHNSRHHCGGSEKQFGDALSVYELQYGTLDLDYMEHWAREIKINALWSRLKLAADISETP